MTATVASIEESAKSAILVDRKATWEASHARRVKRSGVAPPAPLLAWDFERDAGDASGKYPGQLFGTAVVTQGRLVVDGNGYAGAAPITFDLREKTLEAWVQLSDLEQRGGGVIFVDGRQERLASLAASALAPLFPVSFEGKPLDGAPLNFQVQATGSSLAPLLLTSDAAENEIGRAHV